jgi:hypothetical protein
LPLEEEKLWEDMLNVYTQALALYAGLVLAAMVLVFTVLTIFPASTMNLTSLRGVGVSAIYVILSFFSAWVGTRVIVAYEIIGKAMKNIKSATRTLEEIDQSLVEALDPLRLKYRFYSLERNGRSLEGLAFAVIFAFMMFVFVTYYL